jgi:hypothetical protein
MSSAITNTHPVQHVAADGGGGFAGRNSPPQSAATGSFLSTTNPSIHQSTNPSLSASQSRLRSEPSSISYARMIRIACRWDTPMALAALLATSIAAPALDLKDAVVIVAPGLSGPEKNAARMLIEEVEKRTHIRLAQSSEWPVSNAPVIAIGPKSGLAQFGGPYAGELDKGDGPSGAEGYRLVVKSGHAHPAVFVLGNDARGVLFGVGRLLRELHMQPLLLTVSDSLEVATAPKYALRGHQLGYRPKCNSYDAWDLHVWEQYYRDLAVFGCNAIELIPPRSDDDADSPHFPLPPMQMMIGMSKLADDYGLDVWLWYPAMDRDYSDAKTVEFALHEWGEVFRKLPRVDVVFVPGGDPGHTRPKFLMSLLEKQTHVLHQHHPKAQMWISPQSFNQAWMDEFIEIVNREHPAWLSGVVFGPQVRLSLPRLRELLPKEYPIRHYPDITHSRQCQYPVPDWDTAYAVTEARECINPRPQGEAAIFRRLQTNTIGFLTYSEGCNDDVNKFIWSGLGWDPEMDVTTILREYGRYFIGERYAEDFARGLLALERNWQGPLISNKTVDETLAHFQVLEKNVTPALLKNWRLQQALFRAYYDAYVRHRLINETDAEAAAMECLRRARSDGALPALAAAAKALERSGRSRGMEEWRTRIYELADALFQSISMQLSVTRYKAIAVDRGASLDTLDYPLNNRLWLLERFARIRKMRSENDRLAGIDEIVQWTNPGPGGFYDDLGNATQQSHLVRSATFKEDPGSMHSARLGFEEDLVVDEDEKKPEGVRRKSWIDHAETLYDTPLQMHYTGLDRKANYKLRVVYGGDSFRRKIRLSASPDIEIHPLISKPFPIKPVEFALPRAATERGELTLNWSSEPGLGGNGRPCQVSEVWLLKERSQAGHN